MNLHCLKIKKSYFEAILDGSKTFEVRNNDRDFHVGDLITFDVIDEVNLFGKKKELSSDSGKGYVFKITYVLKNVPEYGLDEKFCVFGFKRMKEVK